MFDEEIVNLVTTCYSDLDKAKQILENNPSLVSQTTSIDETPLTLLLRWDYQNRCTKSHLFGAIKLLIDYGADVNVNNCCGSNPLHLAILSGAVEVVKLLLDNKAYINISDGFLGQTSLQCAMTSRSIEMTKFLLDNGVDIYARDDLRQTVLHVSVENDENIEFTKLFVSHGVDVNVTDGFGNTPLHGACYENAQATVKFLIESGAGLYIENSRGVIPMDIALNEGNLDLYNWFISELS